MERFAYDEYLRFFSGEETDDTDITMTGVLQCFCRE